MDPVVCPRWGLHLHLPICPGGRGRDRRRCRGVHRVRCGDAAGVRGALVSGGHRVRAHVAARVPACGGARTARGTEHQLVDRFVAGAHRRGSRGTPPPGIVDGVRASAGHVALQGEPHHLEHRQAALPRAHLRYSAERRNARLVPAHRTGADLHYGRPAGRRLGVQNSAGVPRRWNPHRGPRDHRGRRDDPRSLQNTAERYGEHERGRAAFTRRQGRFGPLRRGHRSAHRRRDVKQSLELPFRLLRDEPRLVARFAIGSLGRSALTAGTILLIRDFLGGTLATRSAQATAHPAGLWTVVVLLFVAFLGAALLTYDTRVTEQRIVKVIELGTMERLIQQLLGLSVGFFDRRTHADLIQSVRQDVTQLRMVTLAVANLGLEAVQAAGLLVAAIVLSPALALWAFVLLPLAAAPIFFVARRTLALAFGVRRKGVVLFDVILQLLHGIRLIKIYQGEESKADRTIVRARSYFDEVIAMERVRALAGVVLATLGGLSFIAVIVVGGLQVMRGSLGWPELLAFLMAVRAAHGPLNNVNTNYLEIQRYGAAVEHLDSLLNERPEIHDRPGAKPLPPGPPLHH